MPGRKLSYGRYRLESKIAHGGMGEVWLGRDTRLEREIAVKFIRVADGAPPDPEHIRRFVRESRITARLQHPGVPAVFDGGLDEHGWPFLVMQRVKGMSIAQLINEQGPLPIGWTAAIAAQVCAVLVAAHGEELIHRDIKPSNLMLEPDGCVKVLDFGLATAPTLEEFSRITMTKQPLGSPPYMAPEQVEGAECTPATDLYALGCTMYEMLTAEPVFSGSTYISVMLRQIKDPPPAARQSRPDVPAELEELIAELLRKDPAERPASAEAVHQRLLPLVTDLGPIIGALESPAKTSPVRLYATVLNEVFRNPPVASTVTAPQPAPSSVRASRSRPAITRDDVAKARTDARRLARTSGLKDAAKALEQVERLARQVFGDTDSDVVRVRYDLATTLFEGGEYRRALPIFRELSADLAEVPGATDLLFDCRLKQATCLVVDGRPADALGQLQSLLKEQAYGDADPRVLELRKQIGLLQHGSGQHQAARTTLTALLADLQNLPAAGRPDPHEVERLLSSIAPGTADTEQVDDAWREALRYANRDESALDDLLNVLPGRGVPAPVVGFELGDEGWTAELAWPAAKVAVLLSGEPDDREIDARDAAFAAAGWDARTAAEWRVDELTERISE
ncbi:serine/threonine-protein kinase [Actinoplanes missouriensis]|uniref:serine/threonine-protein kinase n=1 Tax=Actinoplanes missouriensis TaxID=1866 RepID=UPI0033FAD075